MPNCLNCSSHFPTTMVIEGKRRNLCNRKYCLVCSPFGKHNTKRINILSDIKKEKLCKQCNTIKSITEFYKRIDRNQPCQYCKKCSNKNTYKEQLKRGLKRKIDLIQMKGGKCKKCGYKNNLAALVFHHIDPNKKDFGLDIRKITNSTWQKCVSESNKCILLCANCHAEEHNPDLENLL